MSNNKDGQSVFLPSIDNELSNRIQSLRPLLIFLVILVHVNITEINTTEGRVIYTIPIYIDIIRKIVSVIIATGVPLFFIISGYLLYAKEKEFLKVFKKKSRTILSPYILWHLLIILLFYTIQSFSLVKPYFVSNVIRDFALIDWIDAFVGKFTENRKYQYPLIYQFWFLRDLFVLSLLFIGIKKLVDKFPFFTIILFFLLWLGDINLYVVSATSLLFFTLGYYAVKYSLNCKNIDAIRCCDIGVLYIVTIICDLFFAGYIPIIHKINILLGIILLIKLSYFVIKKKSIYEKLLWMEGYVFFVYAIHGIILILIQKLSIKIIPVYGFWILIQYIGVAVIGTMLSLLMAVIVKNLFPNLYELLTGGRITKNRLAIEGAKHNE